MKKLRYNLEVQSQTVTQLNQLNQKFYGQIAKDFDQTRQQPWSGWQQLLPLIEKSFPEELRVLDVGCGNGRFANFLQQSLPNHQVEYFGIDSSEELLSKAKEQTLLSTAKFAYHDLLHVDLATLDQSFDLIVMFGVLHHIPSFELRQQLLLQLSKVLSPNGLLVFTAWQFDTLPNILERSKLLAAKHQIETTDLEPNDFLLDWQRGSHAIRYCHLTSDEELTQLTEPLQLQKVKSYFADGKNQHTNLYWVGQRA